MLPEAVIERVLTDHQVNQCNKAIEVKSIDQPGAGGAHHNYLIRRSEEAPVADELEPLQMIFAELHFQDGPIKEVGVNGITDPALMAIIIDRLRSFQSGSYACRENALALTKMEEALMWMHQRTRNREARNVEGTHQI